MQAISDSVAIVGATGAVGLEFLSVFATRDLPPERLHLFASSRSAGASLPFRGHMVTVEELTAEKLRGIGIAYFSAGAGVSREFAPAAARNGTLVIDNSSAFRMTDGVPLIVPEINPSAMRTHRGIIANPNCSTIIMAVAIWPLHCMNPVRRIVACTYQAVSGAGQRAMAELAAQSRDVLEGRAAKAEVFPHACAFNVFSHNTPIGDDGQNVEERKMIEETRKIFSSPSLRLAATCVRVPVMRAHTEALHLEFEKPIDPQTAREALSRAPGLRVVDDRAANHFPMPIEAAGTDEVLVGRIRTDASVPDGRGIAMLVCGDQLRKGAALNAVQIGELPRLH